MVRHPLLGSVRFTLVGALLGTLLVATAGIVSAAPSIAANPATATLLGGTTWEIPFATTAFDLDVDCGAPASDCSVWVARNNAAKATEVLFTNVTGARSLIPVTFINDGCFNFRLYDSAHAAMLAPQTNVGHGAFSGYPSPQVCKFDGTGQAELLFDHAGGETAGNVSGIVATLETMATGVVDWDSGFTGGVEDSQLWVTQSQAAFSPIGGPAPGLAFTECSQIPYPNGKEVLVAQNVSGERSDFALTGGGPYCFALYQGTSHTTKIAGPTSLAINPYLQYVGGTPEAGLGSAQGRVYFASGNGDTNALVCVWGSSISGSDILHQTPFVYNSQGWNPGGTVASFQTAGAGVNEYQLHVGVSGLVNGAPTPASCQTGMVPASAPKFGVHT